LAALAGNDNVAHKPLVKHVVSKELILFFDKIRGALLDENPDPEVVALRKSALESVRSDTGLHQLVPYFIQFVSEKVTHSMNNIFVLQQMMQLIQAVTENPTLFIEPYVTTIVPPVLTCLVGHTLGGDGAALKEQYQLRDLAASLMGKVCGTFSQSSGELQARLARTCLKYFLDPSRTLQEQYGGIMGIIAVGGRASVAALVLPTLKTFDSILVKAQNERGPNDESLRLLMAAILRGVTSLADDSMVMTNGVNGNSAEASVVEEYLGKVIGSRVVALGNHNLNLAILKAKEKDEEENPE
jgi:transcription initiation factor TFIID subunit 6